MNLDRSNLVLCITYIELGQWIRRQRIHILADRLIEFDRKNEGNLDLSIFASSEMLKLEDAKARVLIVLREKTIADFQRHPFCTKKNVLDISRESIKGIAPILERYRKNLNEYDLPIFDFSLEQEWDDWLLWQGAHERIHAIKSFFQRIGFSDKIFSGDLVALYSMTRFSFRLESKTAELSANFKYWICLLQKRDQILQKLRVDGFCGDTRFLPESIKEFYLQNEIEMGIDFQFSPIKIEERGWVASDLSESTTVNIANIKLKDRNDSKIFDFREFGSEFMFSPLTAAAYLRVFDEIHYGNCDWNLIVKIIYLVKFYSHGRRGLNPNGADYLVFFILCSVKTEEIGDLKLINSFLHHSSLNSSLGEKSA